VSPSTLQRSNCSVNGVPAGPGAGELEAVKFTDTVATAFEVVLVVGALALARSLPARRIEGAPNGLAASTVALVVAALTATALLSLVELLSTSIHLH
jgi:hypothetical protein